MGNPNSVAARRKRAVETFSAAGESIGPLSAGMSMFAITRGQWSMIDAILWVLSQAGPSRLSVWTWTIAEYEVQVIERLLIDQQISQATMVIDHGARKKNAQILAQWRGRFGDDSVRYCLNHAKIATVESGSGLRILMRGSMNLNSNPRFEQFDLTEGGEDFDVVRNVENELPILAPDCSGAQAYAATGITPNTAAYGVDILGPKVVAWRK